MSDLNYIPLRLHTEFSIEDGMVRIKDAVKRAAQYRLPALGISDLMNVFGMVKFYKACRGAGIKPIVAADVWLENPTQPDKPFRLLLKPSKTVQFTWAPAYHVSTWYLVFNTMSRVISSRVTPATNENFG